MTEFTKFNDKKQEMCTFILQGCIKLMTVKTFMLQKISVSNKSC